MRKLRKLFDSPIIALRLFHPFVTFWRTASLRWAARMYGGSVLLGKGVKIDHPTYFQGKGKLVVDDKVWLGFGLAGARNVPILLQPREVGSEIILGRNCAIMNGCELTARTSIRVGANSLIGPHTLIYDSDFHDVDPEYRHQPGKTLPVVIEENVWIGSRAVILKGVHIGKDSVVGAGSVVTRDIPAGSIVAGNPMRMVGSVQQAET